jgi:hypothetical protein
MRLTILVGVAGSKVAVKAEVGYFARFPDRPVERVGVRLALPDMPAFRFCFASVACPLRGMS